MRHIVVILHGIEALPSDTLWSEELAWRLTYFTNRSLECHARKYGYISGSSVWWNWGFKRDRIVDHEAEYFDTLRRDVGRDTKISIICHSLGGYIVHKLIERGFSFHRIIELYGAGNENQDWRLIEDSFDKFYVWWSPNDEILPKSNFGKIGLVGPMNKHPRVISCRTKDRHTTFMDDTEQYSHLPIYTAQLED